MPKFDRSAIAPYERSVYPGSLRSRTKGYSKLRLSDVGGLTQFGFGEVTLDPGAATGLSHWHEREDEVIYVLEGEATLIEDGVAETLGPGDCATFKAGEARYPTIENRSDHPVRLIEVGSRDPAEIAYYENLDMKFVRSADTPFQTRDGRPYGPNDEPERTSE